MTAKLPTPTDGKCSHCGSENLTIATELIEYHDVRFDPNTGQYARGKHVVTDNGDETRLFCSDCQTYFETPDLSE